MSRQHDSLIQSETVKGDRGREGSHSCVCQHMHGGENAACMIYKFVVLCNININLIAHGKTKSCLIGNTTLSHNKTIKLMAWHACSLSWNIALSSTLLKHTRLRLKRAQDYHATRTIIWESERKIINEWKTHPREQVTFLGQSVWPVEPVNDLNNFLSWLFHKLIPCCHTVNKLLSISFPSLCAQGLSIKALTTKSWRQNENAGICQ